jgi:hypothetical protein
MEFNAENKEVPMAAPVVLLCTFPLRRIVKATTIARCLFPARRTTHLTQR